MKKLELNAVLAGLRLLQEMRDAGRVPERILEILLDGDDDVRPLTNEQIDTLCENLNCSDLMVLAVGDAFNGLRLVGPFFGGRDAAEHRKEFFFDGRKEQVQIVRIDEPDVNN